MVSFLLLCYTLGHETKKFIPFKTYNLFDPASCPDFAAAALILKTIKNASTQALSWSEAVEAVSSEPVKNVQPSLSVPTQITKIGDDYFLVDCYHNQILTSKTPDAPLTDWYVMTDQINRGHTIAGDGTVYLADDTENNRVLIFEKQDGQFYLTQLFNEIGTRPHYVVYDETENVFMYSAP